MRKKDFKPNTVTLNLHDELPLEQEISIEFWKDPSKSVISDLFRIIGMNVEQLQELSDEGREELDNRYFECASLILVDCDIKGIDFSTPETTKQAFEDDRIPWGLFHQALLLYLDKLTEDYSALKNALRRVRRLSDSGDKNSKKDNE